MEYGRRHCADQYLGVAVLVNEFEFRAQREKSAQDAGGGEHADDRNHRSRDDADQRAEAVLDPAERRRRALPLLFASERVVFRVAREELDNRFIDLADLRADDHLVLSGGPRDVDHLVDVDDRRVVRQRLVLEIEAQASDAVDHLADVARPADSFNNVAGSRVELGMLFGRRRLLLSFAFVWATQAVVFHGIGPFGFGSHSAGRG